MKKIKPVFLVGTRWFGVLGPCKLLIEELHKRGHKIYVFGQKDSHYQQFDYSKVELVELNVKRRYSSFLYDLLDILKLMYFVVRYKPVSVHSFNPKPSLICFFSLVGKTKTNFFIGVTGLGNTFIKAKRLEPIISKVLSLAAKKANFVFFQNTDDRKLFIEKLKVDKDKTKLFFSPGVDTDRFLLKKEWRVEKKIKVILVARLLWQKGVDDFVNTYKMLVEKNIDKYYEFTLVGEVDEHHPDKLEVSDTKDMVDAGVNWVKWTDKIEDYYAKNDILLFMSKREGGPRAILEASAVGLPTIGSNCIGVRELIKDQETGYLVESGDIKTIVERLEFYRANKALIEKHGVNARLLIAEKLSLRNATRAQLEMYEVNY